MYHYIRVVFAEEVHYTMMATNHGGHKVNHDGHSNENVEN